MLSLNLGNLDLSSKRCLELMLRPKFMHIIEPWTLRASDADKKLLLKVCIALHRDYSKQAIPLVKSDTSLLMPANKTSQSFDRHQVRRPTTAPFANSGPADKYPTHILKGSTNSLVSDLYHLRFTPIESEPFAAILIPKITRQLHLWQISVLNDDIDRPELLRLLRSLYACMHDVHQQTIDRPRTSSAPLRLFDDSVGPRKVIDTTAKTIQDKQSLKPKPLGPVTTSYLPKKTIYRKPFDSHGGPLPFSLTERNRFLTTYSRDFVEKPVDPWNASIRPQTRA